MAAAPPPRNRGVRPPAGPRLQTPGS